MPTPTPKLTLSDAQEALRRIALGKGATPQVKKLSPEQESARKDTLGNLQDVLTGDTTMGGSADEVAQAQLAQNDPTGGVDLQKLIREKLFPTTPFQVPQINPVKVAAEALWGSPGRVPVIEALQGVGEVGVGIAKGFWDSAKNAYKIVDPSLEDRLFNRNLYQRAVRAVPFMGPPLNEGYEQSLMNNPAYVEGDRNPEAHLAAIVGGVGHTLSETIGGPLQTAFSGQVADPKAPGGLRDATPAEKSSALLGSFLLMKSTREVLARSGRPNLITSAEGDPVAGILKKGKAATEGEIEGAAFIKDLQREQRKKTLPQPVTQVEKPPVPEVGPTPVGATPPRFTTPTTVETTPVETAPELGKHRGDSQFPIAATPEFNALYEASDELVQKTFSQPASMVPDALKDYVTDVLLDPIKEAAARAGVEKGDPVGASIVRVIADPQFKMSVSKTLEDRGVTPEIGQKLVAGSLENATHMGGQTLNVLSQALDEMEKSLKVPDSTAPLDEMLRYQAQVRTLDWWKTHANLPQYARDLQASGKLQGIVKGAQTAERLRIAMMLTKLPTTIHVIKSQAATATIGDIFDAFNTGLVSTAMNPLKILDGATMRQNWADLIGHGVAFADQLTPSGRALTQDILAQNPMIQSRLLTGLMGEADNTAGFFYANGKRIAKNALQAGPGQAMESVTGDFAKLQKAGHFNNLTRTALYDGPMALADVLTVGLRAQEVMFRKYAFRARLEGNLRRLGMTSEELMGQLKSTNLLDTDGNVLKLDSLGDGDFYGLTRDGKPVSGPVRIADTAESVSPKVREALVDAEVHALRSTWAATPDGVLGQMMQGAKLWNSVSPVQTSALFTPFVRAMANNVMWQLHHNPANLADLLLPEYRKAFESVAEDGQTLRSSRDTQRRMGEALTGVAHLTAALNMAKGGQAFGFSMGPKPWIWTTGSDEHGDLQTYDMRNFPQLSEASTFAAMIQASLEHKPSPVTLPEFLEIAGNTRVGQVPMFKFVQNLLNSTGSEEAWNAAGDLLGQWAAPFGNIPQTLREDYGRMGLESVEMLTSGQVTGDKPYSADYSQPALDTHNTAGAVVIPAAVKVAPSLQPEQISPFTGKSVQAPSALAANSLLTFPSTPKDMHPFEWLMTKTPGFSPAGIVKRYGSSEAQALVNRATGELLNDPDRFHIAGVNLRDYAEILNKENNPEFSRVYLNYLLPKIHSMAERMAMEEDMKRSGNPLPPHFVEQLSDRFPTQGIPGVEAYWQQLLKARLKSPTPSSLPTPSSTPPTGAPR